MRFTMAVADGVDAVRKAVREQMRQGADHIKIMVSGGVASPYDPLDSLQFSRRRVAAAVEEAHAFGRYVCAHAYTPEAITRAAHAGVRTIEHGNLIDEPAAKLMAEKGVFLVANLVAYYAMKERAAEFGMTRATCSPRTSSCIDGGLRSLEICKRAGVQVGYGSDLLGQLQVDQSREFLLRREVHDADRDHPLGDHASSARDRSARRASSASLEPGAYADLLVVDGDPLKDLGCSRTRAASVRDHERRAASTRTG